MLWLLSLFFLALFLTFIGTRIVLGLARKHALLDQPNERSSHSIPTPHGGGLAIIVVLIPLWAYFGQTSITLGTVELVVILSGAFLLAGFSLIDDIRHLSPAFRFSLQALIVAVSLWAMADGVPFFGGFLPSWLDVALAGLGWVWFTNLFNFMDGIDGIAGTQSASMSVGIALLVMMAGAPAFLLPFALVATGACLGFLYWNWHPAKIFMGDVGSVPLGFLLAWLLLTLAQSGYFVSALILALYYVADATITLVRRGLRGEKVWQAHREHFYQKAIQRGMNHGQVVVTILLVNSLLVGLALAAALGWPLLALGSAVVLVAGLLRYLGRD
ncbi:MAG: glycosyltransferase family 4 protein [Rhodospirillales bacterium]|nr:glycosyltransferase family 4 protein [Rhodospirillales bacterium]